MQAPFPFLLQTSIALAFISLPWPLQAQTDASRQTTQAAVKYLAAASQLKAVQESECASVVETPADLVMVLRELEAHLPPNDMAAIERTFTSRDFQTKHTLEPQRLLGTMLKTFQSRGMTHDAACRKIFALHEQVVHEQREHWDQTRRAPAR